MAISPDIGFVGTSFRHMPLGRLESYLLPADEKEDALRALRVDAGLRELVYLATCNRLEFYYVADEPARARQRLLHWLDARGADTRGAQVSDVRAGDSFESASGTDAIAHLFEVATGIDSMVVGEPQILGQVMRSLEEAIDMGTSGPLLDRAFRAAQRTAKAVRRETGLGAGPVSIASLAVREAIARSGAVDVPDNESRRIGIIGAGPMASKIARHAAARAGAGLIIVNRSEERGREVASRVGAEFMLLSDFMDDPPALDILFLATAAASPFLTPRTMERLAARAGAGGILMVDLALPRNLPALTVPIAGIRQMGLESLQEVSEANRKFREGELFKAAVIIDVALARFSALEAQLEMRLRLRESLLPDRLY